MNIKLETENEEVQSPEMKKTELFLIRHGQPMLQNALLGKTDSPLTSLGWSQLEETSLKLSRIETVISSSLSRCAAFAQRYAEENDLHLSIENQWQECFFGDWDGRTYQSLYNEHPKEIENFFTNPDQNTPPSGESLRSFTNRVENALINLVENRKGQRVVLFTHAGVIRTLVAWCLKMDYASGLQFRRFAIDYGSLTQLSIVHSTEDANEKLFPQLESLNITSSQRNIINDKRQKVG